MSVDTLCKAQNQTITDFLFNSLSPKSDKHEISPYNINALEERVVMRIEYMNQGRLVYLIFQQILPTISIEKLVSTINENLNFGINVYRV